METIDPDSHPVTLVKKHHRSYHDREKNEYGQYNSPNPNQSVYRSQSNNEVSENGRLNENIGYDEEYGDAINSVNGGRRHSISSDFHGEYGRAYPKRSGMKRGSEKDKNHIKQSWYESIRDRYQNRNRGFKKDIIFPKSLENYRTKYSEIKNTIIRTGSKLWEDGDKRRLTERRKKTVRFDGGHESSSFDDGWMTLGNIDRWDSLRQGSQDSGTKDSGIETSSNFTSSEDSNKGDFKIISGGSLAKDDPETLGYPMSWHLNRDGTHLIGHMILNRTREPSDPKNSAPIIGLKVEGYRLLEDGRRGALIEKVKEGSIADVEGGLRPGDEIVAWNGRSFRGVSSQEVASVIAQSRQDAQVELLISRLVKPSKKVAGPASFRRGSEFTTPTSSPQHKDSYDYKREKPSVRITSPGSPDIHSSGPGPSKITYSAPANASVGGRIEVNITYDIAVEELIVTVICAVGLIPKSNGQARNPYAKTFLLPDKGEKNKRRTMTVANTNEPKWNQSFIYSGIKRNDLKMKTLEVSVWDYSQVGTNDFLGEVLIDVSSASAGEEPIWYHLGPHEEFVHYTLQRRDGDMDLETNPIDHLSPPSTMSRFSDSDMSDYEEMKDPRIRDGASLSSIGSSGSPPPEVEMFDRLSRRDMSPQGRKRTAIMMSREKELPYPVHKYVGHGILSQRSHSAAPTDSTSLQGRTRSQSPKRIGSLSPPDPRKFPSHTYVPRLTSRSATVTPTGSPKKRHLPQIPSLRTRKCIRETSTQDLTERAQYIREKIASIQKRRASTSGWDRQYGGLSDSDLPTMETKSRNRNWFSPDREHGDSDMESVASVTSSAFSTQSERPRARRDYGAAAAGATAGRVGRTSRSADRGTEGSTKTEQHVRAHSSAEIPVKEKDAAVSEPVPSTSQAADRQERRVTTEKSTKSSISFISGMGKKSNSTSQLSATGRKRRLGFGRSGKTSFTVHRSEEVLPDDCKRLAKQGSSMSSDGEGSQESDSIWYVKSAEFSQLSEFIEGLGPGQLVGRQVLGSSSLGEVQLSLRFLKGQLEVEVVRARGLRARPGSRSIPAPYVKVYLVCGKKCLAKAKTAAARRTLDPLYQTPMAFKDIHSGCILQVTVWGDYGRIEGKKVFMGVAQIMLDDLDLNNLVIGWYKLFGTTSLVSGPPSLGLSRRSSLASLDSLKLL